MVRSDRPFPPPPRTLAPLRTLTLYCPQCGATQGFRIPHGEHAPDWHCGQCGEFVDMHKRVAEGIRRQMSQSRPVIIDPQREREAAESEVRRGIVPKPPPLAFRLRREGAVGDRAPVNRTVRPHPSDVYWAGTIVRGVILAVAAAAMAITLFFMF